MGEDQVTVVQADRDAAAERLTPNGKDCPINHTIECIRAGAFDGHSWVQAFARHRQAHTPYREAGLDREAVETRNGR